MSKPLLFFEKYDPKVHRQLTSDDKKRVSTYLTKKATKRKTLLKILLHKGHIEKGIFYDKLADKYGGKGKLYRALRELNTILINSGKFLITQEIREQRQYIRVSKIYKIKKINKDRDYDKTEDIISLENKYNFESETLCRDFKELFKEYQDSGFWQFIFFPTVYDENRIPEHENMYEILNKTKTTLHRWIFTEEYIGYDIEQNRDFPYIKNDFTNDGVESLSYLQNRLRNYTKWDMRIYKYQYRLKGCEMWSLYKSGFFGFQKVFFEDITEKLFDYGGIPLSTIVSKSGPILDYLSVISTITEWFLFMKDFLQAINYNKSVYYKIKLSNCKNRKLVPIDFKNNLFYTKRFGYSCSEEYIEISEQINFTEINTSWREIVGRTIIEILHSFREFYISLEEINEYIDEII